MITLLIRIKLDYSLFQVGTPLSVASVPQRAPCQPDVYNNQLATATHYNKSVRSHKATYDYTFNFARNSDKLQ